MAEEEKNKNIPQIEDIFAEEGEQEVVPAFQPPKMPPPAPKIKIEPEDAAPEPQMPEMEEEKPSFPWKLILIIIAILIILGGIGAGAYYYYIFYYLAGQESTEEGRGETMDVFAPTVIEEKTVETEVIMLDTDFDGLSDEEEKKLNTSIKEADSDGDGLTDREEVKVYLTDPRKEDTDNDGYSDGEEVKNFFNPNGKGKLFDLKNEINKLNNE
ncbi:MAG: hypothetical protein ABH835_03035 [Patescibacteria group bacterium]|nr:hypothetical protein [Patescibacteria group bacterium]